MMEAENTSFSTTNATDPYETYWWLAPKYFRQLSSRPKYLVAIESGIMLIITLAAFGGNALICLALVKNPRLRTATNLLILSLALTDMLTACVTLSVATFVLMNGGWSGTVNPLDVKHFVCQFQGAVSPAMTGLSLHIMALTAVNRYTCVAFPYFYIKMFSKKMTRFMILLECTVIFSLTSIPHPAGFARITLDPRRALCFTTFTPNSSQIIASAFLVLNIASPMAVISFCYFRVFRIIRNSSFQVAAAAHGKDLSLNATAANIKEVKITKTLFAVLLGFIMCWIPVFICDNLSYNMVNPRFPRQGELVFTYFLGLSSAINPVIYGVTNRALRKECLKAISHGKGDETQ